MVEHLMNMNHILDDVNLNCEFSKKKPKQNNFVLSGRRVYSVQTYIDTSQIMCDYTFKS